MNNMVKHHFEILMDEAARHDAARLDAQLKEAMQSTRSKYHREIKPGVWVDVYDVLQAWDVKNPALQHLTKKALQAGDRGHKTREQDFADILASAIRAQELEQ